MTLDMGWGGGGGGGGRAPPPIFQILPQYSGPNSLGPEPIQISEIFRLVKATAATC